MFTALLIDQTENGVTHEVVELDDEVLPTGDVTVAVEWSSLNYKDGLVLTGGGRLARDYPHVPGIDLAGSVIDSSAPSFTLGERVVLTGWRVGELWWGGYATKARVRSGWLVSLPDEISTRQAMAVGTAGFTAMLAIDTLEKHGLTHDTGPVLVTGASGGLGGSAIHFLSQLGYEVTASTGRASENGDALRALGATSVIERSSIDGPAQRPLLSERWAGCIDAVGGSTLGHVIAEMKYGAAIAACGLAGGDELPANVTPFLLRGISLIGIDSVLCASDRRAHVWQRICDTIDLERLESMTTEVSLAEVTNLGPEILAGKISGRTIVRLP